MRHLVKKIILTQKGLDQIKAEYDELFSVKRPQITRRIQRAREFGDLSENSAYDAAKEEQSLLEARIAQLEEIFPKAQIIEQTATSDFVVIGSTVVVEMNDEVHEFAIVGSMEADPAAKKISNESPVGKALLGLKVGEVIEVSLDPVKSKIKLLEIK